MVRSSCSHTTSSDSLGHIQTWICKEEKLQFSSTSIHLPFSICSGERGDEGVLEGDVPVQGVKAFPRSPVPAASDGFNHGTCGNMGHNGHERICKPQPQLWARRAELKREIILFLKINMRLYHLCFFLMIPHKSSALI